MEELLCPSAKRRRSEDLAAGEAPPRATEATEAANLSEEPPPAPDGGGGSGGAAADDVDRISGLPDAILGEIVSLLSTKEAGRTQILASRWRHVWLASPLVVDGTDLYTKPEPRNEKTFAAAYEALASAVSHILSAHPGPVRRFCVPPRFLQDRPATVDAWLSSPALDNLQELEFRAEEDILDSGSEPWASPLATSRFLAILKGAVLGKCDLPDSSVEGIHFPHLKQLGLEDVRIFPHLKHLGLEDVRISEGALHTMISSCPVLECLLLKDIIGVGCIRISSNSIRSIVVGANLFKDSPQLQEVVIVDAPCLERFLNFHLFPFKAIDVTVISAPRLETLGYLNDRFCHPKLVFGTAAIQGLKVVSMTTALCNLKTLAVTSDRINLNTVIELMKCFPCLEKFYIKSCVSGEMNRWRRKHRDFIKSSDIRLKTIVLTHYAGTRSQINFASFFVLNARELESITLDVEEENYNDAFFAEQYGMLEMEKRASRGAQLNFTNKRCNYCIIHVNHVRDLSIADPFECTC